MRGLSPAWIGFVVLVVCVTAALVVVLRWRTDVETPLPGPLWDVRFSTPPDPLDPAPEDRVVTLIDAARARLDVAVFDFDHAPIAEAMARAQARGVRVRVVTDGDTLASSNPAIRSAFATLQGAGVPIVADERRALMHHKFSVVDGEWVATGSWNYTRGDSVRLDNNMAVFHSQWLADNYTTEFERMFSRHTFGPSKPAGVPHPSFSLGSIRIATYFAPQDAVAERIVDELGRAQRSIRFLAFSLTHDAIGAALRQRARGGVQVTGVFETTGSSTAASEYARMKADGLDVYLDGNPAWMHHKVMVLDERVTIFGSFNFSANADEENDENVLVVDDPALALEFGREFQRVLAVAQNATASNKLN